MTENIIIKCINHRLPHGLSFYVVITEYLAEDGVFYIVSPKDVVVARQRDKDDHIDWLIENEKFEVGIWVL